MLPSLSVWATGKKVDKSLVPVDSGKNDSLIISWLKGVIILKKSKKFQNIDIVSKLNEQIKLDR